MRFPFGKFAYSILMVLIVGIMGVILTVGSFQYLGLYPSIFIAFFSFLGVVGTIAFIYLESIPNKTFEDMIRKGDTITQPKRVIIRTPKEKMLTFDEKGELAYTQYGQIFMYGHPWALRKKLLYINVLTEKESKPPIIIIDGILNLMGNDTSYIELQNRIIIKNKPASYSEIKLLQTGMDVFATIQEGFGHAIMSNPKNISEKLKDVTPSDLSNSKI